MRVVHIVFEVPKPNGSGAALRNYALSLSLQRQGQSSTIAIQEYFLSGKSHPARKSSFIEAELPQQIVADVFRRVDEVKPDLVLVEGIYLADIAYALLDRGFRTIIDMHNIESALLKETDASKKPLHAKVFYRSRWARATKAEAELAASGSGVWVCSDADANILRKIAARDHSISVVPNPIPSWCLDADPIRVQSGVRALFVGHLGYYPNVRAVERLVKGIHPAIRSRSPDATLDICGREPGKRLRKLVDAATQTRLVVNPQDLCSIYAQSTVALVPLDMGGGTRLKVLEAMAMGLPVVATAKAVEGLNLAAGDTFLNAETDIEFANSVHRLTQDHVLRAQISNNGRDFARRHHGAEAIDRAVLAALSL